MEGIPAFLVLSATRKRHKNLKNGGAAAPAKKSTCFHFVFFRTCSCTVRSHTGPLTQATRTFFVHRGEAQMPKIPQPTQTVACGGNNYLDVRSQDSKGVPYTTGLLLRVAVNQVCKSSRRGCFCCPTGKPDAAWRNSWRIQTPTHACHGQSSTRSTSPPLPPLSTRSTYRQNQLSSLCHSSC